MTRAEYLQRRTEFVARGQALPQAKLLDMDVINIRSAKQYEQESDGTFTASAVVRGLTSAAQAEAAMNYMQMQLCAAEVEDIQ